MKMKLSAILLIALMVLTTSGCSLVFWDTYDKNGHLAPERVELGKTFDLQVNVKTPYGAPALSLTRMMIENPDMGEGVKVDYEAIQATDVLSASIVNGEADIAIVPTNMAATMFNKDIDYKLAGTSVWGVMYLVSTEDIADMASLKGHNIGLVGRGVTPDALLRYVLEENSLDPETDVTLEYFSGSTELAASFMAGETTVAMIPEPMLTQVMSKVENAKIVIDLQEAWSEISGMDSYPQASLIVRQGFADEHPEVLKTFIETYDASVDWVNDNPESAGSYYEFLGIGLNKELITKAVPGSNLRFVPASEVKESVMEYLDVLYAFNPKLLGDKPASEDMFLAE